MDGCGLSTRVATRKRQRDKRSTSESGGGGWKTGNEAILRALYTRGLAVAANPTRDLGVYSVRKTVENEDLAVRCCRRRPGNGWGRRGSTGSISITEGIYITKTHIQTVQPHSCPPFEHGHAES